MTDDPMVACPVCGARVATPPVECYGPYTLYACPVCALSFWQPMRAADRGFYEANAAYADRWEFHWVAHYLRARGLRGALLDIGCGDGQFLSGLADRFHLTGLDLNPAAIRRARATRGLSDVHALAVEEFARRAPARKYDVITAFHVIEHVEDPDGLLACIAACLRPGGILALAVPNPARWARRWCHEQWDYPPHHLTRWTPHALHTALRRHGLQVHELHAEPLRTLRQLHSAWCDLVWEAWRPVTARLRLGWTLQPTPGARHAAVARCLRRITLQLIAGVAMGPALAVYPLVRRRASQGKGLVVIASAGPP